MVRLRRGGPSIFGRSAEEVERLATKGIAVSVCPGITAASATAASTTQITDINTVAEQRELE